MQRFPVSLRHAPMLLVPVIALMSCSYPNQFQDQPPTKPHAVLTGAQAHHYFDRSPTIFHINGQPTSFWRSKEQFHIPPGPTTLTVIADSEPYDFAPLTFNARPRRHYQVRYEDNRSFAALYDITGNPELLERAKRSTP